MVHCLAVILICICLRRFGCMFLSVCRIVGESVCNDFPYGCLRPRFLFGLRRIIARDRTAPGASPF